MESVTQYKSIIQLFNLKINTTVLLIAQLKDICHGVALINHNSMIVCAPSKRALTLDIPVTVIAMQCGFIEWHRILKMHSLQRGIVIWHVCHVTINPIQIVSYNYICLVSAALLLNEFDTAKMSRNNLKTIFKNPIKNRCLSSIGMHCVRTLLLIRWSAYVLAGFYPIARNAHVMTNETASAPNIA